MQPLRVVVKRFAALLFDVDGTLAETEELHRCAFNQSFVHFDLPWKWDVATYRELLRVTGGKERIRYFAKTFTSSGEALSDAAVAELHRFKTSCYANLIASGACELRPGVSDLIRCAFNRGQRLAIVTTTTRDNVDALLATTFSNSWADYFEVCVCGDDVEHKKPAPDAYRRALDYLDLPGAACLAIEDSRNGLLAAIAAGIPTLIIRSTYFDDDDFHGAWRVVDNLTEITEGPFVRFADFAGH